MPNRLLKEGIVDSALIDNLTAEEEVFFYRLLVVSDDFGRMDARLPILKAKCFPLKNDLKMEKIEIWMNSLVRHMLAIRYQVSDKPYIQILKWEQRVRSKEKYPSADGGHMSVICPSYDGVGRGLGKGLGKGASIKLTFDFASQKFLGTENLISFWKKTYPDVDVDSQIIRMAGWLVANPSKRKSNYSRFINAWLASEQDKASAAITLKANEKKEMLAGFANL